RGQDQAARAPVEVQRRRRPPRALGVDLREQGLRRGLRGEVPPAARLAGSQALDRGAVGAASLTPQSGDERFGLDDAVNGAARTRAHAAPLRAARVIACCGFRPTREWRCAPCARAQAVPPAYGDRAWRARWPCASLPRRP